MSLDQCLKQLHVVHIKVFNRMQYIRLLLFYSVIFQSVIFHSCKFQSPVTQSQYIRSVRQRLITLQCTTVVKNLMQTSWPT